MGGLQPTHVLIVIIIAIILFAPTRLPQLTRGIAQMFSEFRKEVGPEGSGKNAKKDVNKKTDPS